MFSALRTFPELLLLNMPVGRAYLGGAPPTSTLRFLSTEARAIGLPEVAWLASWHLHSLHLDAHIHSVAGAAGLSPLAALGSLTQRHELSLRLTVPSRFVDPELPRQQEHLDLSWTDKMTSLRYLQLQATPFITVTTLQSLGLLPPDSAGAVVSLLLCAGRVQEFGLQIHEHLVDPLQYSHRLSFEAWRCLRRCSARFVSTACASSFHASEECITQSCHTANVVLRSEVLAERWVTEEELMRGRFDQRWRAASQRCDDRRG